MTGQQYSDLMSRSKNKAYRAVFDEYSAYVYTIVYSRASAAPKEDIEECVSDIAAAVNMSSPAVSHHLRNLKQSGLIISRREGKEVLYTLAKTKEAILVHQMIDDIFEINCPR